MKHYLYLCLFLICFCSTISFAKDVPPFKQDGLTLQSYSLSYDSTTIYMSARESFRQDNDIFVSHLVDGKWSKAEVIKSLISVNDELWVNISADEQEIYFIRKELDTQQRKEEYKTTIYSSRYENNEWLKPEPLLVSEGEDICPSIMPDGKTLYFLSRRKIDQTDKSHDVYSLFYTHKIGKYDMMIPVLLEQNLSKSDIWLSPMVGDNKNIVNFTKLVVQKKDTTQSKASVSIPDMYVYDPVMTLYGKIIDEKTQWPIAADIVVKDALTGKVLATHHNYSADGSYRIVLPKGLKYDLDVTSTLYSHQYLNVDCRSLAQDSTAQQDFTLTSELQISINLFDEELQLPIQYDKCEVRDMAMQRIVEIKHDKSADGSEVFVFPIGRGYELNFTKKAYAPKVINIDTRKNVLLSRSELDIDMSPAKVDVNIQLLDKYTGAKIEGSITAHNEGRNEELKPQKQTNLTYTAALRQDNTYRLIATSEGYLFTDTIIKIPITTTRAMSYNIWLVPLREETTVQLSNINFEYNSYELTEESYAELNKVVELLKINPSLKIEIGAHTDDIGGDSYNNLLSQKRGQAAADYIIKKGISADRMKAVGYGKKHPLVPNDSDENRAKNRRVEFKVIGI